MLPNGCVTITFTPEIVKFQPDAPIKFAPLGAVAEVIDDIVPPVVATTIEYLYVAPAAPALEVPEVPAIPLEPDVPAVPA